MTDQRRTWLRLQLITWQLRLLHAFWLKPASVLYQAGIIDRDQLEWAYWRITSAARARPAGLKRGGAPWLG